MRGVAEHADGRGGECCGREGRRAGARRNGWTRFSSAAGLVAPDIAQVLTASVARWMLNPEQPLALTATPFAAAPGTSEDWTEDELEVLGRYPLMVWSTDVDVMQTMLGLKCA